MARLKIQCTQFMNRIYFIDMYPWATYDNIVTHTKNNYMFQLKVYTSRNREDKDNVAEYAILLILQ